MSGGELAQLIEEQHPTRGEADLARTQHRAAAADHRGHRCRVVRRTERRHAHQPCAPAQTTGRRMDLGHLHGVVVAQERHDPRKPFGQHGLARARWSAHQDVVPAGRGHLERGAGHRLAQHIGQVGRDDAICLQRRLGHDRPGLVTPKCREHLAQRRCPECVLTHQARLGEHRRRNHRTTTACSRQRHHPQQRTQGAVETQLPQESQTLHRLDRDVLLGCCQRHRHGEVESGPHLAQTRRGEVDRGPAVRPGTAR